MKIRIIIKTSLLIGGYRSSAFIDKVTATNSLGIPIIPASAIKGALRIEFERLLRVGTEAEICDSSTPGTMCTDVDNLCFACKLFGGVFNQGKLRFSDGLLESKEWENFFKEQRGFVCRTGTGISRKLGTVKEKMLFDKEIIEPFMDNLTFLADIEGGESLTEDEKDYFKCAVKSLEAIGGEKSRGLGWIEATIEENNTISQVHNKLNLNSDTYTDTLLVKLIPKEPIRVSFTKTSSYFYETLGYIPGSTLRGAMAKYVGDRWGYGVDKFIKFFLQSPVVFSNLYPAERDIRAKGIAKPIPISARTCKAYPGFEVYRDDAHLDEEHKHGSKDILIMSFLSRLISEKAGFSLPFKEKCEYCESSLKNISGFNLTYSSEIRDTPRRVITKNAVNRKLFTSKEGALYSYESMDPVYDASRKKEAPLVFSGLLKVPEISGISNDLRELMEILLSIKEINIGGRKNVGFGKAEIIIEDYIIDSKHTLQKRYLELNQEIGKCGIELIDMLGLNSSLPNKSIDGRFKMLAEGKLSESDQSYFTISLTSELILPEPDFKSFLEKQFGEKVQLQECLIDTHRVGGWNSAMNIQKELYTTLSKGSVFLFSIPASFYDEHIDDIYSLNKKGIGLKNYEGFGQFEFCDEFHYKKIFQA